MQAREYKSAEQGTGRMPPYMSRQDGAAMIVCLLMMLAIFMLGTSAAQIAVQEEKASRNERDRLIALLAAEAALRDAELDIEQSGRVELFAQQNGTPVAGKCEEGLDNPLLGLCHPRSHDAFPVWRRIDIAQGASVASVSYGHFTGNGVSIGGVGATSSSPRYLIEVLAIPGKAKEKPDAVVGHVYRITALGYGSRDDVQAVLQSYYRRSGAGTDGLKTGRLGWREILNWEELRGELEQE